MEPGKLTSSISHRISLQQYKLTMNPCLSLSRRLTDIYRYSMYKNTYIYIYIKTLPKKLHHRRPQTVAQIAHEILETSPEHGHTRPAGKQDGTKDRRQAGLGDEPRRRTQHPRQAGRQDQRQEKDKPRGGRHSIPDARQATRQNKDKSWETRPETRAGRRTEHPRPDGRQAGRQDRRQPSEADTASQPRWQTRPETRPQTRERQEQGGGHSIPDQRGDKVGGKTGDKPSEADTASQSRRTH